MVARQIEGPTAVASGQLHGRLGEINDEVNLLNVFVSEDALAREIDLKRLLMVARDAVVRAPLKKESIALGLTDDIVRSDRDRGKLFERSPRGSHRPGRAIDAYPTGSEKRTKGLHASFDAEHVCRRFRVVGGLARSAAAHSRHERHSGHEPGRSRRGVRVALHKAATVDAGLRRGRAAPSPNPRVSGVLPSQHPRNSEPHPVAERAVAGH
jgi:hypothetical protein